MVIQFPITVPNSPAKTNCDGAAWGLGVGAGKGGSIWTSGVEPGKGLIATGPLLAGKKSGSCAKPPSQGCQGRFENFEAYNIKYSNICIANDPVSLFGLANGYALVNGNDVVLQGNRSIVVHFNYTRLGAVFIAFLDSVSAYNNKWPQGGGPKPITGLVGAARGAFLLKPLTGGIGVCGSPQPQQHVILTGVASVRF